MGDLLKITFGVLRLTGLTNQPGESLSGPNKKAEATGFRLLGIT